MIAFKCSSFEYARLLLVIAPGRENLSSSSVLKRSERKEAAPVTVRRTLGKLTGLRAWNFYSMPEPPSRRLHVFISRYLNTYKEVHGNVYGDAAAVLPTIPLLRRLVVHFIRSRAGDPRSFCLSSALAR